MLSFKERANWTPAEARAQFRQNFFPFVQSGGIAAPYTQVSVHFVPSAEAKLFAEFCRVNHAPCPVVYKSEPGQVTAPPIAADLDIRQVIVYNNIIYVLVLICRIAKNAQSLVCLSPFVKEFAVSSYR